MTLRSQKKARECNDAREKKESLSAFKTLGGGKREEKPHPPPKNKEKREEFEESEK